MTEQEQQQDRPEQSVTVEDAGPARKKLTIELPESRIRQRIDDAFAELKNDAAIPGFRPGKTPRRLIERRFGSAIRDEVKGRLVSEAYSQAIEDEKLSPISEPDLKDAQSIELPDQGPLKFELEVEVSPEVELPALDQLQVERPTASVSDEQLEEQLDVYRRRFGEIETLDDAEIAVDDFAVADVAIYEGHEPAADAEPIDQHSDHAILVPGESRDHRGHVAGIIIDDLGKRLVGKKVGHVETVTMTGPASHENERIKDQPITIRIEITAVERIQPAETSQLVERFGMESEDQLKDFLRSSLERRTRQQQEQAMHDQIAEQLLEKVELELPEGLTSRQTERLLRQRASRLAQQGMDPQQVEQQLAEMRSNSEEDARRQLKLYFILDAAARQLDVSVSDQEVNQQITSMAMQQGRRPDRVRQELQRSGEIEGLYMETREQKTYAAILEQATITDSDRTPEQLAEEREKASEQQG